MGERDSSHFMSAVVVAVVSGELSLSLSTSWNDCIMSTYQPYGLWSAVVRIYGQRTAELARLHLCRFARQGLCPEWKRFIRDHV